MISPVWKESQEYSRSKSMRMLRYDWFHGVALSSIKLARRLLRDLAVLCEEPTTTTKDLVNKIDLRNTQVHDEQETSYYLATLLRYTSICWTTIYQCSAPMKAARKSDSPCKALARLENLGNQSNWSSNSRVANLDIGKSREDATHSHSDTQAWAKQMSTTYWKAKHTISSLVP